MLSVAQHTHVVGCLATLRLIVLVVPLSMLRQEQKQAIHPMALCMFMIV